MQQLAETRPRLPPAAVPAAGMALGHQAGGLQRGLHEAVRQRHALVTPDELMEVPHVEAAVALPIEAQNAFDLGVRRQPGRRALPAPIQQAVIAHALQPRPPAAQTAGPHPQHVGGLHPAQFPTHGPKNHFVQLHRPLHGDDRVGHGGPPRPPCPYSPRLLERTFHLLSGADRSCAPYNRPGHLLTRALARATFLGAMDTPLDSLWGEHPLRPR